MSALRDESFYYQYEYKGGIVEIPKEVFWELYNDSKEEIERLNNIIKLQDTRNSRQRIANRKLLERNQDLVIENLKSNNIINELEKELKDRIKNVPYTMVEVYEDESILNKLQELKGSESNGNRI